MFHTTDRNRIEVFDYKSDVVVYDVKKHEIFTSPLLFSKFAFETFPTFSPDGKTLYYCSADSVSIPDDYEKVKYSLCAIKFDPSTRQFGNNVDTLYNSRIEGKSVSFPRVSPDGRFLMYTLSNYGNFSIWHREADLYLLDLSNNTISALDTLNSKEAESYHSWSSNSRWIVFSSRRIDGLYTRPFFAHIDKNGNASKPFLLPQDDVNYYMQLMKSFNIPEFVKGEIKMSPYQITQKALNDKGIDVQFKE
jgi:Tol biopolymer transport system component